MRGGLRVARAVGGYASGLAETTGFWPVRKKSPLPSGPVTVVISPLNRRSASAQIGEELELTLTQTAANMKVFLNCICGVKETHPMMNDFDKTESLADLIGRCEKMIQNSDNKLFKKETKVAAAAAVAEAHEVEERISEDNDPDQPDMAAFLASERNMLLNEIINGNKEEDKECTTSDAAVGSEICLGAEIDATCASSIYNAFIKVVTKRDIKALGEIKLLDERTGVEINLEQTNLIVNAMNLMKMKNREREAL